MGVSAVRRAIVSGGTHTCQVTLALIALAVVAAPAARADGEQTPAPAPAAAPAEEAPISEGALKEVVVTATRREESLSKVPISVTALTQESLDVRGIKDFSEVARFTPGVEFDNSGTNNISIRGISGTGGAGTTGIYIDDTPIQMRALAFNPNEALPKAFDIDRIEVLRGPQGTLFGAGSEGGTVRYLTTQPSVTKTSVYARAELATTQGGAPSYEAGLAVGGPLIDNTLGARLTVWYRRDGGWIDHMNPYTLQVDDPNANRADSELFRLAFLWQPSDKWSFTPAIYYQSVKEHNVSNYWPLYSNPGSNNFVSADPDERNSPDTFYLASLKIQGDLGSATFISNTSYYHRENTTGYEATLYNLGYYQTQNAAPIFLLPWSNAAGQPVPFPLLNGGSPGIPGNSCTGANCALHIPGGLQYTTPGSGVQNGQQNITQEFRLQSNDPNARLVWTTGIFATENRQSYLEQINDPMLNQLTTNVLGVPFTDVFCYLDSSGNCTGPAGYVPGWGTDSYFLQTSSTDKQIAVFGQATYSFTDALKATVGVRESYMKYSFNTFTGGPQLYAPPRSGSGNISENAFTPMVSLQYQYDPRNMYYVTYAKGFRPGGANNPIPFAACPTDFDNFGIAGNPGTFSSDSVNSYEIGAKNNFDNRVRLATSLYYIQWNNIQQLIVPPVCQISFIANTGNATVKGADFQADFAVTSAFSIELAMGYTQARYTENFSFNQPCPGGNPPATPGACAGNPLPLVATGNSIVSASSETGSGQPAAPFTAALALEYHFPITGRDTFVRLDGQYEAHAKWPTAALDPGTAQYDAWNYVTPSTTYLSFRGGMQVNEQLSLQAFVDNLTDTHTVTDYNWTIDPLVAGTSRLQRDYTFRPRTFGLTAIYRR